MQTPQKMKRNINTLIGDLFVALAAWGLVVILIIMIPDAFLIVGSFLFALYYSTKTIWLISKPLIEFDDGKLFHYTGDFKKFTVEYPLIEKISFITENKVEYFFVFYSGCALPIPKSHFRKDESKVLYDYLDQERPEVVAQKDMDIKQLKILKWKRKFGHL